MAEPTRAAMAKAARILISFEFVCLSSLIWEVMDWFGSKELCWFFGALFEKNVDAEWR
jgi:hypothetical protein